MQASGCITEQLGRLDMYLGDQQTRTGAIILVHALGGGRRGVRYKV